MLKNTIMKNLDHKKLLLIATAVVAGVIIYNQVLKPAMKKKSEENGNKGKDEGRSFNSSVQ